MSAQETGSTSSEYRLKENKNIKSEHSKRKSRKKKQQVSGVSTENIIHHTGKSRRPGQWRREQKNEESQFKNSHGYDLDMSIQEELMTGNFKMKGRKTQVSINHLLDFQLPEIERSSETEADLRTINQRKNKNRPHLHLSGDSFINVNYRLLVKESSNYKAQENNPNLTFNDEDIVSVIIPRGQNCPICLCEEPVAPRMVSCGHVFCYSCLINFFDIEETIKNKETGYTKKRKYKDCPLCNNVVRPQRIKKVIYEDLDTEEIFRKKPVPGAEISLILMCKPHNSLLALPVNLNIDPLTIGNFPNARIKDIACYSRVMKCDPSFNLELLQEDIDAINMQYEIDHALFNQSDRYSKLAIEQINTSVSTLLSLVDESSLISSVDSDFQKLGISTNLREKYSDKNAFFFFQTTFQSSTKFFLSPLDVKILLNAFGSYDNFPMSIAAVVENVHYDTVVTEQFIRRYKYVGHLPLGTEIALIDIDWRRVPIIPQETLSLFSKELKQRRRQFNLKQQKEDKLKKIYQAKLEHDHQEFYRTENGDPDYHNVQYNRIPNTDTSLDTLDSHRIPIEPCGRKQKYKEKTIWGTSISIVPDERTSKENQEFADMIYQKLNATEVSEKIGSTTTTSDKSKNKKNKKKGKVLLFSNNPH